jgi:hypothetical protein
MICFVDPDIFWLNVTNIILGSITLLCFMIVTYGVMHEIRKRANEKRTNLAKIADDRMFISSLGITMADGGKRFDTNQVNGSENDLNRKTKPNSKHRSKK